MIYRWYDHRCILFSSRCSLLDYDLSGDMMDASSDVMLLQLHEEHNSVIEKKKNMEEVIFMFVVALQIFCCYACEGFALIFKFVMKII
jgi:hypothetical protein